MEVIPREVHTVEADGGREPFSEWLATLDAKTQAIVLQRIDRVEKGNLGDHKLLGHGISELRIDFGPGYRVYYGQSENHVYLITGGQKRHQQRDIDLATKLWKDQNA